jgi:hypothetical protein
MNRKAIAAIKHNTVASPILLLRITLISVLAGSPLPRCGRSVVMDR